MPEFDSLGRLRAAGGIVWRLCPEGEIEVLLIHRPQYDDWSLPKGKVDAGESDEQAAVREVQEETGLSCQLGVELTSSEYADHNGRPKIVRYWLMESASGHFRAHDEVDTVEWLSVAAALKRLTYKRDAEVLRSANGLIASP